MRDFDLTVATLAERQHGVFRRDQARTAGFSRDTIGYRLRTGTWIRVHDRVYRVAGTPLTWEARLLAACWAGGPRGAASHRSAAALWAIPGGRKNFVEVTCPRWRRAQHPALIVHESQVLDRWDLRLREGIPATSPERTLLDLGAVYGVGMIEIAVDAAVHRNLVTAGTLRAILGRLGRSGRNGAGVLRHVVDLRDPARSAPESPPETRLLQMLRRNGFPEPTPQYEVYENGDFVARVDLAFAQWRIAIEYESLQHHAGSAAVVRDSGRRNRLWAARWQPLTATIADLRAGGAELGQAIRAARATFLASGEVGYAHPSDAKTQR